jgi:hypothetical protein
MKHVFRAAAAAAVLATSGVVAGNAAAAGPPQNYDLDILSQFNANNSYDTVKHLAVDIGPRRSGLPEEDEAAEYLAGRLAAYGFEPIPGQTQMVFQYALAGTRPARTGSCRSPPTRRSRRTPPPSRARSCGSTAVSPRPTSRRPPPARSC